MSGSRVFRGKRETALFTELNYDMYLIAMSGGCFCEELHFHGGRAPPIPHGLNHTLHTGTDLVRNTFMHSQKRMSCSKMKTLLYRNHYTYAAPACFSHPARMFPSLLLKRKSNQNAPLAAAAEELFL